MALDSDCFMLSVTIRFFTLYHYAECRYGECRYAECRGVLSLISSKDCLWLSPPTVVSYLEKYSKANGQFKKNAHGQTQWSVFLEKCGKPKHSGQFLDKSARANTEWSVF
jgi:hypothetical protein